MASPGFTYIFGSHSGAPDATLTLHANDAIALDLSARHPEELRKNTLEEYGNLATVLHCTPEVNAAHTHIEIESGGKAPGALMMFMARDLSARKLVSDEQATECVQSLLAHEEKAHAVAAELPPSMQAAVAAAKNEGAALAQSGARHTPREPSYVAAHNKEPKTPGKGFERG